MAVKRQQYSREELDRMVAEEFNKMQREWFVKLFDRKLPFKRRVKESGLGFSLFVIISSLKVFHVIRYTVLALRFYTKHYYKSLDKFLWKRFGIRLKTTFYVLVISYILSSVIGNF